MGKDIVTQILDAAEKIGFPRDKAIEEIHRLAALWPEGSAEFESQAINFLTSITGASFQTDFRSKLLAEIMSIGKKGPVPPTDPSMTA